MNADQNALNPSQTTSATTTLTQAETRLSPHQLEAARKVLQHVHRALPRGDAAGAKGAAPQQR